MRLAIHAQTYPSQHVNKQRVSPLLGAMTVDMDWFALHFLTVHLHVVQSNQAFKSETVHSSVPVFATAFVGQTRRAT